MRWSKITRFTRSLKLKRKHRCEKHLLHGRVRSICPSRYLNQGGCEKNINTHLQETVSVSLCPDIFLFGILFKKRPSCLFPPRGATSCLSKTSFQPRVLTRHHLEEERSVQLQVAERGCCSMDIEGSRWPSKTKGLKPETCQLGKRKNILSKYKPIAWVSFPEISSAHFEDVYVFQILTNYILVGAGQN